MQTNLKLLRSCTVQNSAISVDGSGVFKEHQADFTAFSAAAFKSLKIDYPKFHKMDNLSKLGFLTAEHLLAGNSINSQWEADKVGIILANANSSMGTDLRYNTQIKQGVASPALFVYTLPNILMGEICIRHGIKGENTLFISLQFDIQAQVSYISSLLEHHVLDICLGGWIDFFNEEYRAFFYLVGPSQESALLDYTTENVATLFTT